MTTLEENCIPWIKGKPATLKDLFEFYHEYVKLLYADVQTQNTIPQEILFELNAAFDHLSRHWIHQESEYEAVHKAYGHLKRACLDVFKIRFRTAVDQISELKKCAHIKLIDNGNFTQRLNQLHAQVKKKAKKARHQEGVPDSNTNVPSFELWEDVWVDCIVIEEKFYFNEHVKWAKGTGWKAWLQTQIWGLILGVTASLAATGIWAFKDPIWNFFTSIH